MSQSKGGVQSAWKGRWTFILAATGSAVGLGNLWKFPYITGEYGGSAFVLAYLLCILIIGIPVMMSEIMLGRDGRRSPIKTMQTLTKKYSAPRFFTSMRSEEHTSELQSRPHLVCRLLLEKKKKI